MRRATRPRLLALALLAAAGPAVAQSCDAGPALRFRGPVDDLVAWPRHVRHAVACFDPVDGVVLLAAMSAAGDRTELWEWNGFRWRRLDPLDGITPPPLADFAATFHEATGRLILFGGTLPSGRDSDRTWLWNGGYWDQPVIPDTPPQPLHAATFAYVPAIESAVLFGGVREGVAIGETWTWNVGGWRRRSDGPAPQDARGNFVGFPRAAAAALCDSTSTREFQGMWHFDGSGWSRMSQASPPVSDSGRIAPTAVDPISGMLTRFSSGGPTQVTQRWIWGGDESWLFDRWMIPSIPPQLIDVTATTDVRRRRIVILGRRAEGAPLELWEQDSTPGGLSISAPEIAYGLNCNVQVMATGDGPLTYQWLRDGVPLDDDATFEGTQSPSLAVDGSRARCGRFDLSCRVCGPCGCVVSESTAFAYPFLADFNVDGGIDGSDIEAFLTAWEASEPAADANCDGGIDGGDVESFFRCWEAGCG